MSTPPACALEASSLSVPVWIWNRSTQPPNCSRNARLSSAPPVGSSTSAARCVACAFVPLSSKLGRPVTRYATRSVCEMYASSLDSASAGCG